MHTGAQQMVFGLGVAKAKHLSIDHSFAVMPGTGGADWVARTDFDYAYPTNTTVTQYNAIFAPNAESASPSPDKTKVAVMKQAGEESQRYWPTPE
jgi:hypothetical protein